MKYPPLVPKWVCKTPITVTVYTEGLDEDGAPETAGSYTGYCNYQDGGKALMTQNEKNIDIEGTAMFTGDILPGVDNITGGEAEIFGETREVIKGRKNRNPDGTVNYTTLWLA